MNDFLIDQNSGDLLIQNGDLAIDDSDQQNIADIIQSQVGTWKQYPQVGCAIDNYFNANVNPQDLNKLIKAQLEADGFTASPKTTFDSNGNLIITPNATKL